MFCTKCGSRQEAGNLYCDACGNPLKTSEPTQSPGKRKRLWVPAAVAALCVSAAGFAAYSFRDSLPSMLSSRSGPSSRGSSPLPSFRGSSPEYGDARAIGVDAVTLIDDRGDFPYFTADGEGIVYTRFSEEEWKKGYQNVMFSAFLDADQVRSKFRTSAEVVLLGKDGRKTVLANGVNGNLSSDMRRLAYLTMNERPPFFDIVFKGLADQSAHTIAGVLHPDRARYAMRWSTDGSRLILANSYLFDMNTLKLAGGGLWGAGEEADWRLRGEQVGHFPHPRVFFYGNGGIRAKNRDGSHDRLLSGIDAHRIEISPNFSYLLVASPGGVHLLHLTVSSAPPQRLYVDFGKRHITDMPGWRGKQLADYIQSGKPVSAAAFGPTINPLNNRVLGPGVRKGTVRFVDIQETYSLVEPAYLEAGQSIGVGDVIRGVSAEEFHGKGHGSSMYDDQLWFVLRNPDEKDKSSVSIEQGNFVQEGKVATSSYFDQSLQFSVERVEVHPGGTRLHFVVRNSKSVPTRFLVGNGKTMYTMGRPYEEEPPYLLDSKRIKHYANKPVLRGAITRSPITKDHAYGGEGMERYEVPPQANLSGTMEFPALTSELTPFTLHIPANPWQSSMVIGDLQMSRKEPGRRD